jgi:TRAP-type C4-dicarboxylate transport system permease small subunit
LHNLDLISVKIARGGLTILVSFLVVFVFMGVICRYILNWTPFFLEELSRYLLIWTGGVGASLAIKSGSFPSVEVFMNWFGPKAKKEIEGLAKIILIAFLLFFFLVGIAMALRQRTQMAATLPISMMWPYLAIPVGIALILPYSFLNLFYLQKGDNGC